MNLKSELKIKVIPASHFELPFKNGKKGWWGSDCAFSTPLDKDKILWLFGDTFIQENIHNIGRENSKLINNSIAIQNGVLADKKEALRFYWNQNADQSYSFLLNDAHYGFLWPFSAVLINDILYIFTVRIIETDREDAFAFELTGNEIFIVKNPFESPDKWSLRVCDLPWQESQISFGSNIFLKDDYLYIYGFKKDSPGWESDLKLMIARTDVSNNHTVDNYGEWEYLKGTSGIWSSDINLIKPVFNNSNTEFSVSYLAKYRKYVLVAISMTDMCSLNVRFSDTPYGPFSDPYTIYKCPEVDENPDYFCYAAKAHPELSESDDELIITYMTNARNLQNCICDLDIYYPKFLKIRFNEI